MMAAARPTLHDHANVKHFQAATAESHVPTPDRGVMTGIVKPEIRNVLQIGWTVGVGG